MTTPKPPPPVHTCYEGHCEPTLSSALQNQSATNFVTGRQANVTFEPAPECHATLDDLENCACPEPAKESGGREWRATRIQHVLTVKNHPTGAETQDTFKKPVHVIEYSAFEQMKRKRDGLHKQWKVAEGEAIKRAIEVETLTRRVAELEQAQSNCISLLLHEVRMDALRTELAQFHKDHDRVYNECRREIRDRMNERDEAHAYIKTVENRNYSVEAQLTAMREREYILKGLLDVSEGARLEALKYRDRALAAAEYAKLRLSGLYRPGFSTRPILDEEVRNTLTEIDRLLSERK